MVNYFDKLWNISDGAKVVTYSDNPSNVSDRVKVNTYVEKTSNIIVVMIINDQWCRYSLYLF